MTIWLLMEPGGEAPTILAAYTDPDVAAATEVLLDRYDSYLWSEEVTNIQQAPPRVVERLWMACYINPDGTIESPVHHPAPYVQTYEEFLVTPDQVSDYPPAFAEHTRYLLGRDEVIGKGRVYVKAVGTDMDAVRAAFAGEIQVVRAELAEGGDPT